MGSIAYTKKALKGLRKLPSHHAVNFRTAFERIAAGDTAGLNITALHGRDGYRLRFGAFRAIYQIEGQQIIVLVLDAGPRGDIYK
ncbi:MAG: type II toxin-antitoxin system RelE/ParE family toxin [Thiotrichales bacterium]